MSIPAPPLNVVPEAPRPTQPVLTAAWRQLVMLTFDASPDALVDRVPAGTELDVRDGRTCVSVVGFRFQRTKLLGMPVPFYQDFDGVNIRFYVVRETPEGEVRQGVVFLRELVPQAAMALLARLAYNEPFECVPMRSELPAVPPGATQRINYSWHADDAWRHVGAVTSGAPVLPGTDSEEAFICARHWAYTRQRDGSTLETLIEHQPWRVWSKAEPFYELDPGALKLAPALRGEPSSVFVAEGSDITVLQPVRLPRQVRTPRQVGTQRR